MLSSFPNSLHHRSHLCFISISQDVPAPQPSPDGKLPEDTLRPASRWPGRSGVLVLLVFHTLCHITDVSEAPHLQCLSSLALLHCTEISTETTTLQKWTIPPLYSTVKAVSWTFNGRDWLKHVVLFRANLPWLWFYFVDMHNILHKTDLEKKGIYLSVVKISYLNERCYLWCI